MHKDTKEYKLFSRFSNSIGARIDYVQGGGGNTSCKIDEHKMLIKASGYYLTQVKENDGFAVLDFSKIKKFFYSDEAKTAEDIEKSGSAFIKSSVVTVEGIPALRPSVEAGFHSILKKWVIHTHSVYSNIILCSSQAEELLTKIFDDLGYIYIPYVNPGSRLTLKIAREMKRFCDTHDQQEPQAIFLQNHGLIVHADHMQECIDLHEKINEKICAYLALNRQEYPEVEIVKAKNDTYQSATDYLIESLADGRYSTDFLLQYPLYPDQIVYLKDVLGEKALIHDNGIVEYLLPHKQAKLLEEALTAIVYIMNNINSHHLDLQFMHDSEQDFIKNWESEKYRKELASK